ncbi:MAG: hypothetical protein ACE5QV_04550 [Fidelibacterota bacterium]
MAKYPSDKGWVELFPSLQATINRLDNPYVNGIEGFFILESSVDADPDKILSLYKGRDKAEKFVRSLKEGNELRPLRHFSKWVVIGAVFICFLATALINLTSLSPYSLILTTMFIFFYPQSVSQGQELIHRHLLRLRRPILVSGKGTPIHFRGFPSHPTTGSSPSQIQGVFLSLK